MTFQIQTGSEKDEAVESATSVGFFGDIDEDPRAVEFPPVEDAYETFRMQFVAA